VASVTTRGETPAKNCCIAWHAEFKSGVRDAEARGLDEAVKKCASQKDQLEASLLVDPRIHVPHVAETVEPRSALSATSTLTPAPPIIPTAVVIFNNEVRTSSRID